MLFNSEVFLFVFLPIVLGGFHAMRRMGANKASLWFLLAASVAFYGFWNPANLWILGVSIAMNYAAAAAIVAWPGRAAMAAGITANLLLLAYFKYRNFILSNAGLLWGGHYTGEPLDLPLGISFYTFTQIAFLVDLAMRRTGRSSPRDYALFVTFFPHLIAGPLFRHDEIVPQLRNLARQVSWTAGAAGLAFFAIGLAKKVVLADNLAQIASPVFSAAIGGPVSFNDAWRGALAYTFQLYFDFSGYSDMAVGLGLMFGIRMPFNFDSPYKSVSIIDFWQRWHITLSRFLRDYLYFPLGGNRHGSVRRYTNLMVVMLLGGLWHGAGWTFVAWGAAHGLFLCVAHAWRALAAGLISPGMGRLLTPVYWLLTFLAVTTAWVLFRSADFATATTLLSAMASPGQAGRLVADAGSWRLLLSGGEHSWIAAALAIAVLLPNSQQWVAALQSKMLASPWLLRAAALAVSILLLAGLFSLDQPTEFIYFQF
jgi:D-alanyl-lipoteichoic acid acyltransferase DltB (MBOAT superfamily)